MKAVLTLEEWKTECKRLIYEKDYEHGLVDNVDDCWIWWKFYYENGCTPEEAVEEFDDNLSEEP